MLEATIKQRIPRNGYTVTEELVGIFEDYSDVNMILQAMAPRFKIDEVVIKPVVTEEEPETEETN